MTDEPQATISVLIADDDPIVRETLSSFVEDADDLVLVDSVTNGADVVRLLRSGRSADVVLMDVRMPEQDGISAARDVRRIAPDTKVVLLTSLDDADMVREAFAAEAGGLLMKSDGMEAILGAVRAAHHGTVVLSPRSLGQVSGLRPASTAPPTLRLTNRELEVLELLCRAYSNSEISEQLHLSESRVKAYVSTLISRFQVESRLQVVVRAFEWGVVRQP